MAYTHAIILDFEATCDDQSIPEPQEIIEFPSVLVSLETQEVVDEFQAFVKPVHNPVLTEFCRTLTSIDQSDVDGAATFPTIMADHRAWLDRHDMTVENSLFVTCGDWDLCTMLPSQCRVSVPPIAEIDPIYKRWQNIKRAFCEVTGRSCAPGMIEMMKHLGLIPEGHHHRGIDDCRNITTLYRDLIRQGAEAKLTTR